VQRRIRALVNVRLCMSGNIPTEGPLLLLQAGIVVVEEVGEEVLDRLSDGCFLAIEDERLLVRGREVGRGHILVHSKALQILQAARSEFLPRMEQFVDNTLDRAKREKELLLQAVNLPPIQPSVLGKISRRNAVIVTRGLDYRSDLLAVRPYIKDLKPALLAVDGAADAVLRCGLLPDLVIGDMDSVSDEALRLVAHQGGEIVVHAYPDGRAPGMARVRELGIQATVFPVRGTSEDAAMLLAHEAGARLIVAVGTHTNAIEFLEKGRPGMASTLLVRLRLGTKLVDAKGVSRIYRQGPGLGHMAYLVGGAVVAAATALLSSPAGRTLASLLYLQIKVGFGR